MFGFHACSILVDVECNVCEDVNRVLCDFTQVFTEKQYCNISQYALHNIPIYRNMLFAIPSPMYDIND